MMNTISLEYTGKKSRENILKPITDIQVKELNNKESSNLLLYGDNIKGLYYLLYNLDLKESIDLIYIDPPYNTGRAFRMGGTISRSEKDQLAYNDNRPFNEYLEFIRERTILLHQLLSNKGSFYLHCDYKIGHYLKIICDEIFGKNNFRCDITRIKCDSKNFKRKNYGNIKDCILFYTKTNDYIWNAPTEPFTDEEITRLYNKIDDNGERYTTCSIDAPGEVVNGDTGKEWRGILPPKGRHWCTNQTILDEWDKQGLIEWSSKGRPRKIKYAREAIQKGKRLQDIWKFKDPTKVAYPTTKNKELLQTIIQASSNRDSIVLDCFSGSGTTLECANELNRRYIGMDNSKESIKILTEKFKDAKQIQIN